MKRTCEPLVKSHEHKLATGQKTGNFLLSSDYEFSQDRSDEGLFVSLKPVLEYLAAWRVGIVVISE